jgi:hypothetical protein
MTLHYLIGSLAIFNSTITLKKGFLISVTECLNSTNSTLILDISNDTFGGEQGIIRQIPLATSGSNCTSPFMKFEVVSNDNCVQVNNVHQTV